MRRVVPLSPKELERDDAQSGALSPCSKRGMMRRVVPFLPVSLVKTRRRVVPFLSVLWVKTRRRVVPFLFVLWEKQGPGGEESSPVLHDV